MVPNIQTFLSAYKPLTEEVTAWLGGQIPLRVVSYLSKVVPPVSHTTSARCLLLREKSVLVCRNRDGVHILPGGRLEKGESYEATLRREVLEETSWTIASISLLGFVHYRHLKPKPPGYRYPYPDFLQVIFTASPDTWHPDAKLANDYEIESSFQDPAAARGLGLHSYELAFLETVLAASQ